jgi:hypothetical protein
MQASVLSIHPMDAGCQLTYFEPAKQAYCACRIRSMPHAEASFSQAVLFNAQFHCHAFCEGSEQICKLVYFEPVIIEQHL